MGNFCMLYLCFCTTSCVKYPIWVAEIDGRIIVRYMSYLLGLIFFYFMVSFSLTVKYFLFSKCILVYMYVCMRMCVCVFHAPRAAKGNLYFFKYQKLYYSYTSVLSVMACMYVCAYTCKYVCMCKCIYEYVWMKRLCFCLAASIGLKVANGLVSVSMSHFFLLLLFFKFTLF